MIVTFKYGGEELRWDFHPARLMSVEAEAIEKVTGLTYAEWGAALLKGSAGSSRALVWVLRKRSEPTLRYRDVDFPIGDLGIDLDAEEKAAVRVELASNTTLTDDERAEALAALGDAGDESIVDGPGNGSATGSVDAGA
jgi:hypothetical protein